MRFNDAADVHKYIGGIFREAFEDDDGTGETGPTAVMSTSADTGNAYWQGKVNLPIAMAMGTIKVEGNFASLLKLAPLGKKLYPRYVGTLKRDGRDDLLA